MIPLHLPNYSTGNWPVYPKRVREKNSKLQHLKYMTSELNGCVKMTSSVNMTLISSIYQGEIFRVLFCFLHSVSTVIQKTGWSNWALKLHLEKSRLNCGTVISHRKAPWDTNKVKERRKPLTETWPSWPETL